MNELPLLLTCPFCGSEPRYIYRKLWKEWFIACKDEQCNTIQGMSKSHELSALTAKQAAERWNKSFERKSVLTPEKREV